MERINISFDKLFNFLPGYIFGLLAFSIGFCGDIIALVLSPDYIMWEKSISVLTGKAGGIYFRLGLIISSLFSIPFIIYIGRFIKHDNVNENLRKSAIILGIFTSVCAILTALFFGGGFSELHGFFALFSWISGAIFCTIFSIMMLKNTEFSKFAAYIGFIVAGIFLFYLVPFFITNYCNYYKNTCYSLGQVIYTIMPTTEWIVNFSIQFWYLFNSSYLLYKKKI